MKANPRITVVAVAILCAAVATGAAGAQSLEPQMLRFRSATVTTQDLAAFERDYAALLGYRVRERGTISRELAASWGAKRMSSRKYLLLSSDASPDVLIRAVDAPAVPDYRPLTTHGWNAIEIIVQDPDQLRQRFTGSPFAVIGEPEFLGGYPTIRAFQVRGPSQEVLYLTAETGDRSRSPLPAPGGEVGRIFIMVVAGPDINALNRWYSERFKLTAGVVNDRSVGVLARAQNLRADQTVPLTTIRLGQRGNLLELDGYPPTAGARPQARGLLPPGIALVSVAVRKLDALKLDLIAAPRARGGALYRGARSATVRGSAGELLELIEE
jgi:hypothetical protein